MPLFRLAYISRSLVSGDASGERHEIADILLTSRRNNEAAHVTGALLAMHNRFAQVQEGDRAAVEETYRRICADTRHTDIVMVLMEPINARQFPQWSMACIGPSQSAAAAAERVTSDVPHFKTGDGARALTDFMSRMLAVEAPTPAAN